jgi:hypothetical protein
MAIVNPPTITTNAQAGFQFASLFFDSGANSIASLKGLVDMALLQVQPADLEVPVQSFAIDREHLREVLDRSVDVTLSLTKGGPVNERSLAVWGSLYSRIIELYRPFWIRQLESSTAIQ